MKNIYLQPELDQLCSEEVFAQAWKKTVTWIRHYNWVEDPLELELSSLRMPDLLHSWMEELSHPEKLSPEPLRLILAPKSSDWEIDEKGQWNPTEELTFSKLRPMGHASLRDQTLATVLLMGLADIVENRQGDPELPFSTPNGKKVVSYGNRLLCRHINKTLRFGWGNSKLYRRYFVDYQKFIDRPLSIAHELGEDNFSWAIVHLDLSKFYDKASPRRFIQEVLNIIPEHSPFLLALKNLMNWRWATKDNRLVNDFLSNNELNKKEFGAICFPQGLVASGFFANIYLLSLDISLSNSIGNTILDGAQIHDYCRYVDDLRIVLKLKNDSYSKEKIQDTASKYVNNILKNNNLFLSINKDKTEVILSDDSPRVIKVRKTMKIIQQKVSGPLDFNVAQQVLDSLGDILNIPQNMATAQKDLQIRDKNIEDILTENAEIPGLTISRFAAYRIRKVFRDIRPLLDEEPNRYLGESLSRNDLDNRIVGLSRRLIKLWIKDPSNIYVLRIALDLVPDPLTLQTIIDLLKQHLLGDLRDPAFYTSMYVAGEMFRAGTIETGYVIDNDELNEEGDIETYRAYLSNFANFILTELEWVNWNVKQQALLYLANHSLPYDGSSITYYEDEIRQYLLIHEILLGRIRNDISYSDFLCILYIHHLQDDFRKTVRRLIDNLNKITIKEQISLIRYLIVEYGELAHYLWEEISAKENDYLEPLFTAYGINIESNNKPSNISQLEPNKYYQLLEVTSVQDNPFENEIALLKLTITLIDYIKEVPLQTDITPHNLQISCADWTKINSLASYAEELDISVKHIQINLPFSDHRFEFPEWCSDDFKFQYRLGQILKGTIHGNLDYTLKKKSSWKSNQYISNFKIPHSWHQRRYGMPLGRSGLGEINLAISDWFAELIDKLTGWPGLWQLGHYIQKSKLNSKEIRELVKNQLMELSQIYGTNSKLPILVIDRKYPPNYELNSAINVALIQTVLPHSKEFEDNGFLLNRGNSRRNLRRHLRSVLYGIGTMYDIRYTHLTSPEGNTLDYLIFPELSIHIDDLPLLLRFLKVARCGAFCGLTFLPEPRIDGSSSQLVNVGCWIIPSHFGGRHGALRWSMYIQGKQHLTNPEISAGVIPYRPCQWIIQQNIGNCTYPITISASICYDSTDLSLATDLRNITDGYFIAAKNQDIQTFDNMVSALHYHMFQHVLLVNSGEYGGSTLQAPYETRYLRTVIHHHGNEQVAISFAELDLGIYQNSGNPGLKHIPAGYTRH
ncbi:RNA-directed DNA polymerase [bacterium]|nr:RNA-directed DNA polymerase [bacterium]